MSEPHPRPWKKAYAKTFTNNGTVPLYILNAEGRKICVVWGREDGEREATADLIIKAVRTYDKAQKLKAERDARMGMPVPPEPDQMPLFEALDAPDHLL